MNITIEKLKEKGHIKVSSCKEKVEVVELIQKHKLSIKIIEERYSETDTAICPTFSSTSFWKDGMITDYSDTIGEKFSFTYDEQGRQTFFVRSDFNSTFWSKRKYNDEKNEVYYTDSEGKSYTSKYEEKEICGHKIHFRIEKIEG